MILGFGNNLVSSLASDITASQTTIPVMPGDGQLFATLLTSDFSNKSTTLKNYAKITLTDAGETAFEICHLISVSGDNLTVIRGQEGTAAKGWSLKDVIANFATRGSENGFPQIAHIQSGYYTSGTAGGLANALTLELPSTFFLNGSVDWVLKTPIVVYPSQNNTGASTLQLTIGGRVLGSFPLYKGNKSALDAGDLVAGVPICCLLDQTKAFFNVINPVAAYFGKVRTVNSKGPDANGNVLLTAGDVGAVQQGGGTGMATNKVYLGWDGSKLIVQVDESSLGKVFCERFPPTAGQCGAFPAEGGTVGSKGITTPGLFVNNHSLGAGSQGLYLAWNEQVGRGEADLICNAGSGIGGFIFRTVNNDNTKEFGRVDITGSGSLNTGNTINEMGQRVYSPNNPPVSANLGGGWWKDNVTGMIIQMGAGSNASSNVETFNFNIAFPNTCVAIVGTLGTALSLGSVVYLQPTNNSQFTARTSGNGIGYRWIAIGY